MMGFVITLNLTISNLDKVNSLHILFYLQYMAMSKLCLIIKKTRKTKIDINF
jgi:hypothetical protein